MVRLKSATLRNANPWLLGLLRLLDAAAPAALVVPLVKAHIGDWAQHYESLMLLSFALTLTVFHSFRVYRPWRGRDFLSEARTLLGAWIVVVCSVLFLLFAFKIGPRFSRVVLTSWFLLTPLVHLSLHGILRAALRSFRARGWNLKTAVVIGAGELGTAVAGYIRSLPWAGIRILGFFDDQASLGDVPIADHRNQPVLGTLADLPGYLQEHPVDFLYIALPMREEPKIRGILQQCRTLGARIYYVPDLYAFGALNSRIERFGDLLLLDFNPDSSSKRLFDLAFSSLVLIATLPLMLFIALLIKVQDGGPVFYRHRRITATGKEFGCIKFRTMHVDADRRLQEILAHDPAARAEWEQCFKLKKDPRVTWIGKFLRRTSLDELPQFINVLTGDMSVVGARPIVQQELLCYYRENGGLYCSIKPGITGPWQVSQRSDTNDYRERVELDTWYVLNRSFWLDLKIIAKTVVCMLNGKGAY